MTWDEQEKIELHTINDERVHAACCKYFAGLYDTAQRLERHPKAAVLNLAQFVRRVLEGSEQMVTADLLKWIDSAEAEGNDKAAVWSLRYFTEALIDRPMEDERRQKYRLREIPAPEPDWTPLATLRRRLDAGAASWYDPELMALNFYERACRKEKSVQLLDELERIAPRFRDPKLRNHKVARVLVVGGLEALATAEAVEELLYYVEFPLNAEPYEWFPIEEIRFLAAEALSRLRRQRRVARGPLTRALLALNKCGLEHPRTLTLLADVTGSMEEAKKLARRDFR